MASLTASMPPTHATELFGSILPAAASSRARRRAAIGDPLVATNVPGTRELVVDDQTGFLVPFGDFDALADRMQLLRTSPELAAALGRAGRERIQAHFDERQVTARVLAVYEHVRERKAGPLPQWNPGRAPEVAGESA